MESVLAVDQSPSSSMVAPHHLHGILNIRKPAGWTSHDVVVRLRRLLGIRKIGHAGTLDPPATGVLPVLLGKGTKIADYLLGWEKEYVAVLRLGESTDTQDATGTVIGRTAIDALPEAQIRSTVREFEGNIQQIPPMYSAVKVNGQPLYKAARRGETVKRNPRAVTIYRLDVLAVRGRDVDLRILCSKGTYIRTLCSDIGDRLHVGGHLLWLERSRVGPLHVQDALDVRELRDEHTIPAFSRALMSIDDALVHFPAVIVKVEQVKNVINGVPISWQEIAESQRGNSVQVDDGQRVRVRSPQGQLLAIGLIRLLSQDPASYERKMMYIETMCVER